MKKLIVESFVLETRLKDSSPAIFSHTFDYFVRNLALKKCLHPLTSQRKYVESSAGFSQAHSFPAARQQPWEKPAIIITSIATRLP